MYLLLAFVLIGIVVTRFKKHPRQNKASVTIIIVVHWLIAIAASFVSVVAAIGYLLVFAWPSIKSAIMAEKRSGFAMVWIAAVLGYCFSWLGYLALPKIIEFLD